MPDLISIKFKNTNLLQLNNSSKSLGNIITNLKNLEELKLNNFVLNSVI